MIVIGIAPVAFSIGSVEFRWYGIMIVLGVLALVLWALREIRRGAELSYDAVLTAAIVGILSGIVFSRLLHVIDRWDLYKDNLGQIIGGEGLTIYGAVLGAALAIWIYSRFSNFKFAYAADVIAPGIILAQAIGRVGCTINGCCYGTATSLPWGIVYTNADSLGYKASQALLPGMGLHPTQVYEIIFLSILFVVLLRLKGRLKPNGSLFLIYLGGYSLWRIGIDFIRDGTPFLFGLHQAQVIGIIVVIVTVVLMLRSRVRWAESETIEVAPQGAVGGEDDTKQ
jgi:phosphatidylglycerol:prolipoprotein diacylglycerol transferase